MHAALVVCRENEGFFFIFYFFNSVCYVVFAYLNLIAIRYCLGIRIVEGFHLDG